MNEAAPPAGAGEFDPADRGSYRLWRHDVLRFADLDPLGHVNNGAYGIFCESGRVAFFEDLRGSLPGARVDWVLRHIEIDFRRELHFPGTVDTGTRIARFGNSSVIFRQGIFSGETCSAVSRSVCVCFDPVARKARPIPDEVRALMQALSDRGHAPS